MICGLGERCCFFGGWLLVFYRIVVVMKFRWVLGLVEIGFFMLFLVRSFTGFWVAGFFTFV